MEICSAKVQTWAALEKIQPMLTAIRDVGKMFPKWKKTCPINVVALLILIFETQDMATTTMFLKIM